MRPWILKKDGTLDLQKTMGPVGFWKRNGTCWIFKKGWDLLDLEGDGGCLVRVEQGAGHHILPLIISYLNSIMTVIEITIMIVTSVSRMALWSVCAFLRTLSICGHCLHCQINVQDFSKFSKSDDDEAFHLWSKFSRFFQIFKIWCWWSSPLPCHSVPPQTKTDLSQNLKSRSRIKKLKKIHRILEAGQEFWNLEKSTESKAGQELAILKNLPPDSGFSTLISIDPSRLNCWPPFAIRPRFATPAVAEQDGHDGEGVDGDHGDAGDGEEEVPCHARWILDF